jgi:hypothetical protein
MPTRSRAHSTEYAAGAVALADRCTRRCHMRRSPLAPCSERTCVSLSAHGRPSDGVPSSVRDAVDQCHRDIRDRHRARAWRGWYRSKQGGMRWTSSGPASVCVSTSAELDKAAGHHGPLSQDRSRDRRERSTSAARLSRAASGPTLVPQTVAAVASVRLAPGEHLSLCRGFDWRSRPPGRGPCSKYPGRKYQSTASH